MKPIFRTLFFLPIVVAVYSFPWYHVMKHTFSPIKLVKPYGIYLIDRFILLKDQSEAKYQSVLHVFLKENELKYLAVPQSKGGPKNQMMFSIQGFAAMAVIFLISIPVSWIQMIGFCAMLTTVFAFIMLSNNYDHISFWKQEVGVKTAVVTAIIGILSIAAFIPKDPNGSLIPEPTQIATKDEKIEKGKVKSQ